jgi:hypothetical protein
MFEEDQKLSVFCEQHGGPTYFPGSPSNSPNGPGSPGVRAFQEPPADRHMHAYWQMQVVARTVTTGDFLTPTIYVPRSIWAQVGVKFAGLSAKSNAYKTVVQLMQSLATMPFDDTEHSLTNCLAAVRSVNEECFYLQNSLAKSFPFIREVEKDEDKDSLSSKGQVITPTAQYLDGWIRLFFRGKD